ncbi:hypothetical protein [Arthrobacter sp. NA-172]|uniref:hypothetical protein n=1 Tax=Arthrobacter sp. NA-172 TaxID=3367524 RepID=UPI0037542517
MPFARGQALQHRRERFGDDVVCVAGVVEVLAGHGGSDGGVPGVEPVVGFQATFTDHGDELTVAESTGL